MRRARMAQKKSLTELARQLGYTKEHLSRVETGATTPSPTLVNAYQQALGIVFAEAEPQAVPLAQIPKRGPGAGSRHKKSRALQRAEMQTWLAHLREFKAIGQLSQIPDERTAMYLDWSNWDPPFTPQLPELHEFLCKCLLQLDRIPEALQEANYMVQASQGSLLSLQQLCLLQFESHDLPGAAQTLEQITANPASEHIAQVAGLQGRLHRERWMETNDRHELDLAQAAYQKGYDSNIRIYYLGINAFELQVAQGHIHKARAGFRQIIDVCDQLILTNEDQSFWVYFTRGEARLGYDGSQALAQAKADYAQGLQCKPGPTNRDWRSALGGLHRIVQFLKLEEEVYESIAELRNVF